MNKQAIAVAAEVVQELTTEISEYLAQHYQAKMLEAEQRVQALERQVEFYRRQARGECTGRLEGFTRGGV